MKYLVNTIITTSFIFTFGTTTAFAVSKTWQGLATNWFANDSWNPVQPPLSSDDATVNTAALYPIINNGNAVANSLTLNGLSTLQILNGSRLTLTTSLSMGDIGGSNNVATISGLNSILRFSGANIGTSGSGTINITNNASMFSQNITLGSLAGSSGAVTVDNSTWDATAMEVGFNGSGAVTILNGAQVTANGVNLGGGGNGNGVISISGPGSQLSATSISVAQGNSSLGNLNISGGAEIVSSSSTVGSSAGSIGTITMDGVGTNWDNIELLLLGSRGQATLNIQNGAFMGIQTPLLVSNFGISSSAINLTGTENARGLLQVPEITKGAGASTVTFNGGILRAAASTNNFVNNFAANELIVTGEGLFVDSNGFSIANNPTSNFYGSGGITKIGLGRFTLTGNNPYTGLTQVNRGIFNLTGSTAGSISVAPGARLEGNGSALGNITVNGVIAPGNSIGTLSAASYTSNPGSTYEVEINPAGQSDLITVTGQAVLNGGAVSVLKAPGAYPTSIIYTIVNADGGVTGTYDSISQNLPFLGLLLTYDPTHVYLQLFRNTTPFVFYANTPNEAAVALSSEALGMGNPVYNALVTLNSPADVSRALNSLSGEIHASVLSTFVDESRYARHAVLNHLRSSTRVANELYDNGWYFWNADFGSWGDFDSTFNTSAVSRHAAGLFLGADKQLGEFTRIGVLGGYSRSNLDINTLNSTADSDNYHVGLYGKSAVNRLQIRAGGVYTWQDLATTRNVSFSTLSNQLNSDYTFHTGQLFAEAGYPYIKGDLLMEPFMGIAYVNVDSNDWQETGGAAALSGAGHQDVVYSTLGLNQRSMLYTREIMQVDESVQLGWQHAYSGISPFTSMNFVSGSLPLGISGAPIAEDSLLIDAGFNITNIRQGLNLRLSYMGQLASSLQDHGVAALISWKFA